MKRTILLHNFYFQYFVLLVLVSLVISYFINQFVITSDVYHNSFGERLTYERIEKIIATRADYAWIGYILTPVIYLVKFTILALILSMGDFFKQYQIGFKKNFCAVIIAETVFLAPDIIRFVYFGFFKEVHTFSDLSNFSPWSLVSLFNKDEILDLREIKLTDKI